MDVFPTFYVRAEACRLSETWCYFVFYFLNIQQLINYESWVPVIAIFHHHDPTDFTHLTD